MIIALSSSQKCFTYFKGLNVEDRCNTTQTDQERKALTFLEPIPTHSFHYLHHGAGKKFWPVTLQNWKVSEIHLFSAATKAASHHFH